MGESRLCLPHGGGLDSKGQIFRFRQAVVSLGELCFQHPGVLIPDIVVAVKLMTDADVLFEVTGIRSKIYEGQLELHGAVKEVKKAAPLLEDRCLVLLLCQLVVDVLKLDGFRVVVIAHAADPVRKHALERNGLLRGPRNPVVFPGSSDDVSDFPFLFPCQVFRKLKVFCLSLRLWKQSSLPPFLPHTDA